MTAVGLSCVNDVPFGLPETALVRVDPDSTDLRIGNVIRMQAAALDEHRTLLVGKKPTWSSDNTGIATVSAEGVVQGMGSGVATITALIDGMQGQARVRVQPAPSIGLSATSLEFAKTAGGEDPDAESIEVTNTGGFDLIGLAAEISYGPGADDWLVVELNSDVAPATLTVTPNADAVTAAGEHTATVSISSFDAINSPRSVQVSLTVTADAPANVAATGNEQIGIAGEPVPVAPAVTVTDQFGNPVQGVDVTFEVTAGGGSVTDDQQITNADGVATVGSWILGTSIALEHQLVATADAPGLDPVTFTATAGAAAPANIEPVAGDAQAATVATMVAVSPSVRVSDQYDNPVAGVPVTFAATVGAGTVMGGSQATDTDGVATVGGWTLGTTAGPNQLSATVADGPLVVTFSATGTADVPTSLTVTAGDGQTATVATTLPVSPAVVVQDQYGNEVPDVTVTFAVASGNGSLTGEVQVTGGDGVAVVGSWTLGTPAGTQTLEVSVGQPGVDPVTVSATATPDAPFAVAKEAGDNQSATVGTAVGIPPRIRAADQYGNAVAGVEVTFEVSSGDGEITGPVQFTNVLGLAEVGNWTLGPAVGVNTLTATAPGLMGSPLTFTANGNEGGLNLTLVDGDGQTGTVAQPLTDPYVVRVTDEGGLGVEDVVVAWTVTGGGGSITESSVTDADGFTSVARTLGTNAAVPHTARAVLGGLEVNFTATAVADVAASITVSAGNNQSAEVNTAVVTPPAAVVRDQFNNPVPGHAVTFAVTGGGGAVSPETAVTTNASGIAAVTSWTMGITAGTNNNTLSATAAGGDIAGNPLTFTASATPGPASLTNSLVSATGPITANNNASSISTVTVTVRDQFNNPRSGHTITYTVSGSGNFITQPSTTTNASGVTTGSWYSTQATVKTVTATISGTGQISQTANVTVNPAAVSLANSLVSASPTSITASTGSSASTVTATVRDAFGNVRSGHTVTLSSTGTNNTFSPNSSGVSDGNGQLQRSFSSITAQGKTISASVTGVGTISQTVGVTVNPGPPASMVLSSGNNQIANVFAAVSSSPTVRVRDEFLNWVSSGWSITFTVSTGGGWLGFFQSSIMTQTDASGFASASGWVMGESVALTTTGLRPNSLTASRSGLSSVTFNASGRYTYNAHISSILTSGTNPCTNCHAISYAWVTGIANCNTSFRRVPTTGGTTAESNSVLMRRVDNSSLLCPELGLMPQGGPQLSTTLRDRIRGWIRAGAPQS